MRTRNVIWILLAAVLGVSFMFSVVEVVTADQEIANLENRLMKAAPAGVVKNATLVTYGKDRKPRVVREGLGVFTCLTLKTGDICFDKNSSAFFKARREKITPPMGKIGFSYMLAGDDGASNTDPHAMERAPDNHWVVTGPHVMIVGTTMDGYPAKPDPDLTQPYVMWAGTPYAHLMIPIR